MTTPENLKYTRSHEWVKSETDGTVTVGITFHAQEQLGDVVFIQNPEVGRKVKQGEECAVIESVKAAADIYAPVSGEVIAANQPGARESRPVCRMAVSRQAVEPRRAGGPARRRHVREARRSGKNLRLPQRTQRANPDSQ
jgi:glycine cleavage system H protein